MSRGNTTGRDRNQYKGSTTTTRSALVTGLVIRSIIPSSLGAKTPLKASVGCGRDNKRKSDDYLAIHACMQDNNSNVRLTWTDKDEQFPLDNMTTT